MKRVMRQSKTGHKFLCQRDTVDFRDRKYCAPMAVCLNLPIAVNLESKLPGVWDQQTIGSCTAHGCGEAVCSEEIKQRGTFTMPSRLFVYWNPRVLEGTSDQDSGCQIRDVIKCLAKQGACPESEWIYDVSKYAVKPPDQCFVDGVKEQALKYESVPNDLAHIKGSLAEGFPVVVGLTLYSSFESAKTMLTGIVPMPSLWEQYIQGPLGGHCLLVFGYNDKTGRFLVRNSWGMAYKNRTSGNCEIPYAYFAKYGNDFWKVELVQ